MEDDKSVGVLINKTNLSSMIFFCVLAAKMSEGIFDKNTTLQRIKSQ